VYDDENRPISMTYPSGGGSATDTYEYNALGQRMRAMLEGWARRFVYFGDRVLEVRTDGGDEVRAQYTTESGSYYDPLVHSWRAGDLSRFPLYDGVGSVRMLVDENGSRTHFFKRDAFGRRLFTVGSSFTKYQFGGAWGYMTDPSGLLQLGARFYWPEIGRFIQQDPVADGVNWYAYVGNNPLVWIDPEGLIDIFLPIEAEIVTPWGGIDASVGIVIDTDCLAQSGLYSSGGPAAGLSLGLGAGVGVANDVEGFSQNADVNVGPLSATVYGTPEPGEPWGLSNWTGGALTAGPGLGAGVSNTQTGTVTFGGLWDRAKHYGGKAVDALRSLGKLLWR